MKDNPILKKHVFCFNPSDNGGEGLTLTTEFIGNGDKITSNDGVYLNQELTLQSYCNFATFNLIGTTFTPENLRKLADQLEEVRKKLIL